MQRALSELFKDAAKPKMIDSQGSRASKSVNIEKGLPRTLANPGESIISGFAASLKSSDSARCIQIRDAVPEGRSSVMDQELKFENRGAFVSYSTVLYIYFYLQQN
ncbi:hypothetical protein NDU88_003091 [Pleurodeles waltl]|uniref:Uncharacterized protein n=1 Tax=Pleurodeles waltl TaxID=8319 RepID=A0AAV7LED9_PLEWA|nr:hypothetical protein NDU88_003091 [Pleurodeles waltl]